MWDQINVANALLKDSLYYMILLYYLVETESEEGQCAVSKSHGQGEKGAHGKKP